MGQSIGRMEELERISSFLKASLCVLDDLGESVVAVYLSQSIDILDKRLGSIEDSAIVAMPWDLSFQEVEQPSSGKP